MPLAVNPEINSPLDPLEEPSLSSLRSSMLQYRHENGRTYHTISDGKYNYPNDDQESERLDLQHYIIWTVTFDGDLALNPGRKTAKRVLDMGTGTGMWAIDYADTHSAAEVIGVDLSPIQLSVPPSCQFEIGDLALPMGCNDGTIGQDSAVWKWHEALCEASKKIGRPIESLSKSVPAFERAGFVDVVHTKFVWPFNTWPRDPKPKEVGRWQCLNLDMGLEAFSLALLTRAMGWTKDEVRACCSEVRKDIRNRKMHHYWTLHFVYARKLDSAPKPSD